MGPYKDTCPVRVYVCHGRGFLCLGPPLIAMCLAYVLYYTVTWQRPADTNMAAIPSPTGCHCIFCRDLGDLVTHLSQKQM